MIAINSIEKLIESLDQSSNAKFPEIIKAINMKYDDFESCMTWKDSAYTRNCIVKTDTYELILLCWEPGAVTAIHDHGGEDCWVYQLEGSICEIRYKDHSDKGIQEVSRQDLKPGSLSFMNDKMGYHAIANHSSKRALTLHVYASPITSCNVYMPKDGQFEAKNLSYDTIRSSGQIVDI
jgi:cysteine dioxygenase